jgi:hypothetical protein
MREARKTAHPLRRGKRKPGAPLAGMRLIACTFPQSQLQFPLTTMHVIDLTQRPPRSPKTRLGGYALLPRMLDKCRAEIAGKSGSFHYACPNDQRILQFAGIDPDGLKAEVAKGAGDGEILEWIKTHQANHPSPVEIEAWSDAQDKRKPGPDDQDFFNKYLAECGPERKDIVYWSDLLDLDDYVSYGGKA